MKPHCNVDELLECARSLLLGAPFDHDQAAATVSRLQACTEQARAAGDSATEQRLRSAANELKGRIG